MHLTKIERERKISEFLDRKLKEFDLDEEDPLTRTANQFGLHPFRA